MSSPYRRPPAPSSPESRRLTVPDIRARITPAAPAMTCVFDDNRRCIGFVLSRGRMGHEAFAYDGARTLGIHPTMADAANAICLNAEPAS